MDNPDTESSVKLEEKQRLPAESSLNKAGTTAQQGSRRTHAVKLLGRSFLTYSFLGLQSV